MSRLDGAVPLSNGTGGAMGRAAAIVFAAAGAKVVGCDVKVDERTRRSRS
jgi:meso-butanediol dehydrogenase / (S,S)-butanediol dehydrogenase / diacetyl reductase